MRGWASRRELTISRIDWRHWQGKGLAMIASTRTRTCLKSSWSAYQTISGIILTQNARKKVDGLEGDCYGMTCSSCLRITSGTEETLRKDGEESVMGKKSTLLTGKP